MMTQNDSTAATLAHIRKVNTNIIDFSTEMLKRAKVHDESKLLEPEKSVFDEYTHLLYKTEYNSPEYKGFLEKMKPAIQHHEQHNSHHPAYYAEGINGMNLYDVVEMFCDWKAASERTVGGSLRKSLDINRIRFNMSDQLYHIFLNTINKMEEESLPKHISEYDNCSPLGVHNDE